MKCGLIIVNKNMVKIGAKETVKYMSVYGSAIAVTSIAADNTIENHKKNGKVVK